MEELTFKTDLGIIKIIPAIVDVTQVYWRGNSTISRIEKVLTCSYYLNDNPCSSLSALSNEQYIEFMNWKTKIRKELKLN